MNTPPDITGNLEGALSAAEKGYVPIPVLPGTKVPAVKWKPWQEAMPPEELIRSWFADPRRNLAIITAGLVVFDCDDPAKIELVLDACGDTPHRLRTPRGGEHLGYRRRKGVALHNQVDVKGLSIDIRTDGGLELLPPSVTEKGTYEWLSLGLRPISELPVAKIGWTRERAKRVICPVGHIDGGNGLLFRRARAYLATVEGAISGQGGHRVTFRISCKLTHLPPRGFGLSFEEAMVLLQEWNQRCQPPWSERELTHKLSDAIKIRGVK